MSSEPAGAMLAHSVSFGLHDASEQAKGKLTSACKQYLAHHPGVVFFAVGTRAEDFAWSIGDLAFDVALQLVFRPRRTTTATRSRRSTCGSSRKTRRIGKPSAPSTPTCNRSSRNSVVIHAVGDFVACRGCVACESAWTITFPGTSHGLTQPCTSAPVDRALACKKTAHATGKQPVAHIGSEWKSNYEAAGAVADTTTSSIQLESTQTATSRQGYSEQTST